MRDISSLGMVHVSSSKLPNGNLKLIDGRTDTFWQSDGPQPHRITVNFPFRVTIERVLVYVDFKFDESYTPSKISVLAGTCTSDLIEIVTREFEEPSGWLDFEMCDEESHPIQTNFIQIAIHSNHQNGKDTHVRLIKVLSPEVKPILATDAPFAFQSTRFTSFLAMR